MFELNIIFVSKFTLYIYIYQCVSVFHFYLKSSIKKIKLYLLSINIYLFFNQLHNMCHFTSGYKFIKGINIFFPDFCSR